MARLNAQGLARRQENLMGCILFDTGMTGISMDLSSGEPTVTSHYSQDKNYKYACFDGVGKSPFYRDDTLMIDDIYLMSMSQFPGCRDTLKEAFHSTYRGNTFAEQWLENSEVVKGEMKDDRALLKVGVLGLGYGMGPTKLVKQCYDKGYVISRSDGKEFHQKYWEMFSDVKVLANKLSRQIKMKGWIVNPFGYRIVPEDHKAFNYFIQSSVSGIMHLFGLYLFRRAPYAQYITCIHDEFLVQVPDELLDTFRVDAAAATQELNDKLAWTVNVRTGFEIGKNWYEAK